MNETVDPRVQAMTLDEKASLLSGLDGWHTKPVKRLGIPSLLMTDGPHGMRLSATPDGIPAPATAFPTGVGLAASWNIGLIEKVGRTIGAECRRSGVDLLLGPALNIKRSPLCGRNFEYYAEDPWLAGNIAAAFVRGLQSTGVGACLKHYALNNMEKNRQNSDSVCDRRTMHEIYLSAFERAVRESKPWTVMCSYNKINGTFAADHHYLMTEVLRDTWGFDGFVMTDWGALNDRVEAVRAGVELEMPASGGATDRELVEAVESGKLEEAVLDRAVERVLRVIDQRDQAQAAIPAPAVDLADHHRFARQVAAECMVLLKNEGALLPLALGKTVAVIGPFADRVRVQGGGSSRVPCWQTDVPLDELRKRLPDVRHAPGCDADAEQADPDLLDRAVRTAAEADIAVVFLGLPDRIESEGYDRSDMRLPAAQEELLSAVLAVQPETVVVLMNGSPVEMPWADRVPAVLEAYLGGSAAGGAIADLLTGRIAPSGRLAESFPFCMEHNPSYLHFPDEDRTVQYAEGVYAGYRYYTTCKTAVRFPFGHGLGYTTFAYSRLRFSQVALLEGETLTVSCRVRNTGDRTGGEVVQLYVSPCAGLVRRPERELKGFAKIELAPGEEQEVTFTLDKRSFSRYDASRECWVADSGVYTVRIGSSCTDIRLEAGVAVYSTDRPAVRLDEYVTLEELAAHPDLAPLVEAEVARLAAAPRDPGLDAMGEGFAHAVLMTTPLRVMARHPGSRTDRAWVEQLLAACRDALET
jgi:beta-glucosidase